MDAHLEWLMEKATEISQISSNIRNSENILNMETRNDLDTLQKLSDKIWNGLYKIKNLS